MLLLNSCPRTAPARVPQHNQLPKQSSHPLPEPWRTHRSLPVHADFVSLFLPGRSRFKVLLQSAVFDLLEEAFPALLLAVLAQAQLHVLREPPHSALAARLWGWGRAVAPQQRKISTHTAPNCQQRLKQGGIPLLSPLSSGFTAKQRAESSACHTIKANSPGHGAPREHFLTMASHRTHIWNSPGHKPQLQPRLCFNRIIRAELKCCYPPLGNVITERRLHHPEKGRQGPAWTDFRKRHRALTSASSQTALGKRTLHPGRSPHIQLLSTDIIVRQSSAGKEKTLSFLGGGWRSHSLPAPGAAHFCWSDSFGAVSHITELE